MKLRGEDISDAIRTPSIGMGASTVSAHPEVRAALLDLQRQAGSKGGVVLEGRDIGSVVFPEAEAKFFLTAPARGGALCVAGEELAAKGGDGAEGLTFEGTLEEVRRRDAQDMGRAIAPLRQADDAVLVESSALSIDETVAAMVSLRSSDKRMRLSVRVARAASTPDRPSPSREVASLATSCAARERGSRRRTPRLPRATGHHTSRMRSRPSQRSSS